MRTATFEVRIQRHTAVTSQSEQRGAELLFDVISNSRISYFSYADGCACVSFCVTLGSIRRKLTIYRSHLYCGGKLRFFGSPCETPCV